MATDGEIILLRDMLAQLDRTLRDHIKDTQEARREIAANLVKLNEARALELSQLSRGVSAEIAKLNEALLDLKLWKAKLVGISGFVAFLASFLSEWIKSLIPFGPRG